MEVQPRVLSETEQHELAQQNGTTVYSVSRSHPRGPATLLDSVPSMIDAIPFLMSKLRTSYPTKSDLYLAECLVQEEPHLAPLFESYPRMMQVLCDRRTTRDAHNVIRSMVTLRLQERDGEITTKEAERVASNMVQAATTRPATQEEISTTVASRPAGGCITK